VKKLFIALFFVSCAFGAFFTTPVNMAKADALCYLSATYPTPVPTNAGAAVIGLCPGGVLQVNATTTGAPTPIPYPTATGGVLLVQPTNVPTIGVTVVNTPTVTCPSCPTPLAIQPVSLPTSFQTAFPTPIPFPTLGVNVLNTPTVNQGTSPWVVNTPPPFSGSVTQGTSPWVVTTPPPTTTVTVTQATGTNLHAVIDSGTITANAGTGFPTPIPFPTPKSGTILTSASATACTNVQAIAGKGFEIINSGPATTVFLQIYNDAAATCAAGTLLYGDGSTLVVGAGQVIKGDFPVVGIAYKLSGALAANLSITGL
jgi:hypothetical protein